MIKHPSPYAPIIVAGPAPDDPHRAELLAKIAEYAALRREILSAPSTTLRSELSAANDRRESMLVAIAAYWWQHRAVISTPSEINQVIGRAAVMPRERCALMMQGSLIVELMIGRPGLAKSGARRSAPPSLTLIVDERRARAPEGKR